MVAASKILAYFPDQQGWVFTVTTPAITVALLITEPRKALLILFTVQTAIYTDMTSAVSKVVWIGPEFKMHHALLSIGLGIHWERKNL